jgi:hypothetical protein
MEVTHGWVALEDWERVGISVQFIGHEWASLLSVAFTGDVLASVHTVHFPEWNSNDSNSSENCCGQLLIRLVYIFRKSNRKRTS